MDMPTYLEMLSRRGNNKRTRDVSRQRGVLSRAMPKHPSYKTVEVEGNQMEVSIVSSTIMSKKVMDALPGYTFYLGQIVDWEDTHWLVIEKDMDETLTSRGTIEICNIKLRWQNTRTGEIIERWTIMDKPYYSNLSENKTMTISQREFNVKMPYDEETKLLDIGKRIMPEIIDGKPKTYRITSVDSMTDRFEIDGKEHGFLNINIEQDQYNETVDNADLMICDYFDPKPAPEEHEVRIVYSGNPEIKCGAPRKVFRAEMDGVLTEDCSWVVDAGGSDAIVAEEAGGKIYLRAQNRKDVIGKHVVLKAIVAEAEATLELEVVSQ